MNKNTDRLLYIIGIIVYENVFLECCFQRLQDKYGCMFLVLLYEQIYFEGCFLYILDFFANIA